MTYYFTVGGTSRSTVPIHYKGTNKEEEIIIIRVNIFMFVYQEEVVV